MRIRYGFSRMLAVLVLVGGALATAVPLNSYGDPPPWAPAHGKRKKGDPYTGYTGKKWDRHYGVINGRCNREAVGAVVGAAAGGAIGSQVGKGENRQIAILVGTIAGAVIGAKIGRDIDQTDRACIGHALELAGDKKRVTWSSADNSKTYLLTPVRGFEQKGVNCREFDLRVTSGDHKETSRAKACPGGDGTWRLLG
ncbi:MAG: glycine zipper 2TM domain-containing protein [Burkholderiales bacterium]